MSSYLQFDSLTRSDAFIKKGDTWYPNDTRYSDGQGVQTPSNYKVFYGELNDYNTIRTIGFLKHCRERPDNLTYSVEFCTAILPSCTRVKRPDGTIVNLMDEPYIYIRVLPVENSEGTLIYTNNSVGGDEATFIAYLDKIQIGTSKDNCENNPPGIPTIPPECTSGSPEPTFDCIEPSIVPGEFGYGYTKYSWITFKSCMVMPMRLKLDTQAWCIRFSDRFGNDLIMLESDNGGAGYPVDPENPDQPPLVNPDVQSMVLVGIKPNYPVH